MKTEEIIVKCPHCENLIIIYKHEINCAIFRHGVIISTGKQMDPHSPKLLCDELAETGLIYGCGKPFRLINSKEGYAANICEYI